MSEVRFACTACGKCCQRPPTIYMDELLRQSETFPWFAAIMLSPVEKADKEADRDVFAMSLDIDPQLDPDGLIRSIGVYNMQRNSRGLPTRDVPRIRAVANIGFVSAETMDGAGGGCSKLLPDGKCGVHSMRPDACEIQPVHPYLTGAYREQAVSRFTEIPGRNCDTGSTAPVLLRDGKIVDENVKRAWVDQARGVSEFDMGAVRLATKDILDNFARTLGVTRKSLIRQSFERGPLDPIHIDLGIVVHAMIKRSLIDPEEAAFLLASQARLLRDHAKRVPLDRPCHLSLVPKDTRNHRGGLMAIADLYDSLRASLESWTQKKEKSS